MKTYSKTSLNAESLRKACIFIALLCSLCGKAQRTMEKLNPGLGFRTGKQFSALVLNLDVHKNVRVDIQFDGRNPQKRTAMPSHKSEDVRKTSTSERFAIAAYFLRTINSSNCYAGFRQSQVYYRYDDSHDEYRAPKNIKNKLGGSIQSVVVGCEQHIFRGVSVGAEVGFNMCSSDLKVARFRNPRMPLSSYPDASIVFRLYPF